jgi:AraC-like DNA-binding protein
MSFDVAVDRGMIKRSPSVATSGVPCSLHLETLPAAVYREYPPSPALKSQLVCAWTLEICAGDRPHRQRILPDGCSDIVWIGEARPIVVGPMTRSAVSTTDPGTMLVGLRFRPEVTAHVFGVPADELADRHVGLDQLWRPAAVSEASERLLERRTAAARVAVAQSLLASRCRATAPPDPLIQRAIALLSGAPQERVNALAGVVGVTERHLRRRFLSAVGYRPKLFQRVLRFQRLIAMARIYRSRRLGDLAVLAGYADQAHMTREVGEFAGVPPSALLGSVVSALTLSDLLAFDIEAPSD